MPDLLHPPPPLFDLFSQTSTDSTMENHFFPLAWLLYPHVRATPNYTAENPYYPYFDRAWPEMLHLLPTSPLISEIDFLRSKIVLFRRVDLLFNQEDLETIYQNTTGTEA
ncbi:hypothetical protein JVT61DRAFT_13911 [Boletus reticuloceps]|uniref:Uncharacterized protein n=1 Tax=Boletus reticuloceps TaxID=495285 RepID=A0A8I3ACA1_9AGAM|nr:hypothetical protein JVT61DRAFT_13911 [Boletus reticuloceps]